MIAKKDVELLEESAVKLTITVNQEEVKKEYNELIKKYSKSVALPGFRKGKVPASVLEKKFGEGLQQETSANILDKTLKEALETIDEKPLHYSQPELDGELDFDINKDFTFSVKYDTYPKVELGEYKGLEISNHKAEITAEDLEREIKALQEQNAIVIDKEDGVVEKDNIVTVDYIELDEEGNEKEDTKREGFVFTVGTGYNLYKFDDEVTGMKKDEEKVIEKEYGEDEENKELAGKKISVKVKVTAVKTKDIPEADDDLAQDISDKYETLEDLKKDLQDRLEQSAESKLREMKIDQIIDQIIESSTMVLPKAMVQMESQNRWQQIANQYRIGIDQIKMMMSAGGKTVEEIEEEWRPAVEKSLKTTLIVEELLKKETIEVSDEALDEEIGKQAELANMDVDKLKEQLNAPGMMDYFKRDIQSKLLFDFLLDNTKKKRGKKIKYLDLMQEKQ